MDARLRQRWILDKLATNESCSYQELTENLGVSSMTVRRDVESLAKAGAVIKTVGGVFKAAPVAHLVESSLPTRLAENLTEKRAIARCAAGLIGERKTIFLDGSTTSLELAKVLTQHESSLTVVTNSALISMELWGGRRHTILAIGGQYDPDSFSYVGTTTEDVAGSFHVELAFVSTKGFVPAEGTFESSAAVFRIKQIIARQCEELILLVDQSKFGERALCKVLKTEQIHTVITDQPPGKRHVAELKRHGCALHVASIDAAKRQERGTHAP